MFVRIESRTACGHCASRSYCGLADMEDKVVEVPRQEGDEGFRPGQSVMVLLEQSLGYKALVLGYLIPLLLLVGSILLMLLLTGNEPLSALTGLALMVPWYAWLYRSRQRLRRTFHFHIRPASGPSGKR